MEESDRTERCQKEGYAFIGYYLVGKSRCEFPIGVFSSYRLGAAQANAWQRQEPRQDGWSHETVYAPLTTEEPADA